MFGTGLPPLMSRLNCKAQINHVIYTCYYPQFKSRAVLRSRLVKRLTQASKVQRGSRWRKRSSAFRTPCSLSTLFPTHIWRCLSLSDRTEQSGLSSTARLWPENLHRAEWLFRGSLVLFTLNSQSFSIEFFGWEILTLFIFYKRWKERSFSVSQCWELFLSEGISISLLL